MIFNTPALTDDELEAINRIEVLRRQLRYSVAEPRRWFGMLRRTALARAIQGSNSIEGYLVDLDDAIAAVEGEEPIEAAKETWQAVVGYRNAMTYVLQLASDRHFDLNESLIKSLHFMMLSYDLRKNPGRWRPGLIYIRNDRTGEIVYEGPDAEVVPALMGELTAGIRSVDPPVPALVRAAMAHLNLAMIHPFSDGNGRMARCLQTLVLARDGVLAPEFSSIEEYLGANTEAYYSVLGGVGQGRWQPERDARPWVRFALTAHFRQATTILRRIRESEALWALVTDLVRTRGLPPRTAPALFDAAYGRRLRRNGYQAIVDEDVSDAVARRDLLQLVGADLLTAHGEKRGRFYLATPELATLRERSRQERQVVDADPFVEDAAAR